MNTHPNTPFGKLFATWGLWKPHFEGTIEDIYNQLHGSEQIAVQQASGLIAIISQYNSETPDIIWKIIQSRFPTVTKEAVTDLLNNINAKIKLVDGAIPADFDAAVATLQTYLSKYEGKTWAVIVKAVVAIGADILTKGTSPIQIVETVLEYVYQTFIKGKI